MWPWPFTSSFATQNPDDLNATRNTKGYITKLTLTTALVYAGAWLVAEYVMGHPLPAGFIIGFGVLALATYLIVLYLIRASKKRPQVFVTGFIGSLGAKLFLSMIILVVAGLLQGDYFRFTALAYLVGYFALSAVEISSLLPYLKEKKE